MRGISGVIAIKREKIKKFIDSIYLPANVSLMNTAYETLLKRKNLSLTAVRLSLLEVVEQNPHSCANHIYEAVKKKIPTVSIQAVYNNLNALTDAEIIREIKPKGHVSLYETRVADNHHHVICRNCGKVKDTNCLGSAPCLSPESDHGFALDEAEIVFWGICPECQTNPNEKKEKQL
ncbi:MAG: Fur family transcriptional regulator [Hyphomicrobiales bacterium]|nr:Fur family transcriptional regulator [Hyphomicrobiales bacterium]